MNVLKRIVDDTRSDVARRRREVPLAELERSVAARSDDRRFARALTRPGLSVIAEHKRRSPSAGPIREGATVTEVVRAYERGGAAALSVLTEPHHFGGSLDDLCEARAATTLPILRKDFVVDPYQLYESAAAGADAVLLIVAALGRDELGRLHAQARAIGLDVLVEVHDADELAVAVELGADVIGINNRDLTDFTVDLRRTFELVDGVPARTAVVSESGIETREQLDELRAHTRAARGSDVGVDAVLIGELLMRASDPAERLRELAPPFSGSQASL